MNYVKIFSEIDAGMSYTDAAQKFKTSEDVLKLEHISFCKNQPDYDKNIQRYAIKLIQDVGVYSIRALMHETEFKTTNELETFFNARAEELIPYKYRTTVKALACNYVKELDRNGSSKGGQQCLY